MQLKSSEHRGPPRTSLEPDDHRGSFRVLLCGEKPEEHVAVVGGVHCEEAGVAFNILQKVSVCESKSRSSWHIFRIKIKSHQNLRTVETSFRFWSLLESTIAIWRPVSTSPLSGQMLYQWNQICLNSMHLSNWLADRYKGWGRAPTQPALDQEQETLAWPEIRNRSETILKYSLWSKMEYLRLEWPVSLSYGNASNKSKEQRELHLPASTFSLLSCRGRRRGALSIVLTASCSGTWQVWSNSQKMKFHCT